MKVLHVSETIKGGIESYLQELISHQLNNDYEIDLISQDNNIDGINKTTFKNRGRVFNVLSISLWVTVLVVRRRPDVIHIHSSFAGIVRPYIYLLTKLLFLNSKIIYCSHGWPFTISLNENVNSVYKIIESCLSVFCDDIVCISNSEFEKGIEAGINYNKLTVIHNGISNINKSNSELPNDKNVLRLLFVGRFDREKGLDILLNSFPKCSRQDVQLDIVGEPVLTTDCSLKAQYQYDKRISWHGWKDRNDIVDLYSKASATILPSRLEGFGLVAIESLRAGTPVICSAVGGLLDICQNGINGYQFNLSVDELTKVIDNLDKDVLNAMGNAARQTYLSNFTAEKMFQKTDILYHSESTFGVTSTDASGTDLRP